MSIKKDTKKKRHEHNLEVITLKKNKKIEKCRINLLKPKTSQNTQLKEFYKMKEKTIDIMDL